MDKYRCPKCDRALETVHDLAKETGRMTLCPRCRTKLEKVVVDTSPVETVLEAIEVASNNPAAAVIAAYRALYGGDFDRMDRVPFGRANRETNEKILEALMGKFPDERVGIGMLWVNNGFSVDPDVPNGLVKHGDAIDGIR